MQFATETAIAKARTAGIAWVGMHHDNRAPAGRTKPGQARRAQPRRRAAAGGAAGRTEHAGRRPGYSRARPKHRNDSMTNSKKADA